MTVKKKPFTCLKCGVTNEQFMTVCPQCGQRYVRDYLDTVLYPRDPDLTGVCTSRFWIRIFLVLMLGSIVIGLLVSSGALTGIM